VNGEEGDRGKGEMNGEDGDDACENDDSVKVAKKKE
jgi:hypothetical protein